MNVLAIFGYSGGIVTLLGAVIVIGRSIFRQTNAVEDNTDAIHKLTEKVGELQTALNSHETRIAVLEDRERRQWRGGRRET